MRQEKSGTGFAAPLRCRQVEMGNAKLKACRGGDLNIWRRRAAGRQQYGALSSEKGEMEVEGGSLVLELEMLRFN